MITLTLAPPTLKVDLYASRPQSELGAMIRAIDKVVSEEVQLEFDGIGQEDERVQWRKGDLTNDIWSAVLAAHLCNSEGQPYTFMDICYYVRVRFLRRSRSPNTIKAWALTARRYSPKVRERYRWLDIPFSHFTYAGRQKWDVTNPKTGHKFWQDILDYSWELSQNQGYSASQSQLQAHFEPDIIPVQSNGRVYQTGVQIADGIGFAPVALRDDEEIKIEPKIDVDYEMEIREQLHRLNALVQGLAAKKQDPKVTKVLFQALSLMWQAIGGR